MSTPAPGNQQYDLGEAINKLSEGQKVFGGRYTLMKIVGRSLYSVSWLAWDEKQNRDVALKFLPVMGKEDPSAVANLKREIKKLQDEIKGPQLVAIYDVEIDGLVVALATEYVEGNTLAILREQKKNKCFAPQELADMLQQLCTVLEQAHNETHILHGNIKPTNLLVTQKGQLKIADYGLNSVLVDFISRTSEIRVANRNLSYISPQKANGAPHTLTDEIYELGSTMYELLTSRPPFYTGDLILQVNQKVPPPMVHRRKELRVIGEPIPRVWEETIAACLAKDPTQRPQSISKLVEGLELEAPPSAEMQEAPAAAPQPAANSNKTLFIAVAVIVLVGAVGGVLAGKMKKKDPVVVAVQTPSQPSQAALDQKKKLEEEAAKAQRDLEAKRKQAEDLEKKLKADAEKLKAEQAKQAEAAKKMAAEAEAKRKAAEEELKLLQEQTELLKKKAATEATEASKKAEAESAAKVKAAEERAKQMLAEAQKLKDDEAKRIANAKKMTEDTEAKRKAAEAEAKRMASLQEENRIRQMAMAAEKAKRDAEEKAMAEARAQQEAARIEAEKKAQAAALAARRFTAGKPWFNSLGIKFVPVGQTMVAIWEVRYSDYDAFIRDSKYAGGTGWKSPGFKQDTSDPVVNVSWDDAQAFCKWLTEKEGKETLISGYKYRLPTDQEWSAAALLSGEAGGTPAERDRKITGVYPWGNAWPPPAGAGNYENRIAYDRYEHTSPVASFPANPNGIYDLGGNVWEWCEDVMNNGKVVRGGSWQGYEPGLLFSSTRKAFGSAERKTDVGFRLVLIPAK
ncbi:MAG TPA: SUMF1/EgtB/PvdO family nonheme iron enzyme [Verrucomicrobiae bacterium]